MKYEDLIETISEIVENTKIYKTNMTLVYALSEKNHKQMNEELFYKSNPSTTKFAGGDEFEVELGGVIIKFIKEKTTTLEEISE